MKHLIIACFFFSGTVCAQTDLSGSWRINTLIGLEAVNEYRLTPPQQDELHIYGNRLELHADSTFISAYSAWCGNDCFKTNTGTFEHVDKNHIRFRLLHVHQFKMCDPLDLVPDKDLGLFYIHRDSTGVRLIRSNGDSLSDARNEEASTLIDAFDRETKGVSNLHYMPWKNSEENPDMTAADVLQSLVDQVLAGHPEINTGTVSIRFSKTIREQFTVMLLEDGDRHFFVVCENSSRQVAFYDPANPPER